MRLPIIFLTFLLILGFSVSCNKEFLDVSDELAEERDFEKIFSNPTDVRRWHRHIYIGVPNTMNFLWYYVLRDTEMGIGNPWTNFADEMMPSMYAHLFPITRPIDPTDNNNAFGRWQLYKLIRQANIFLERVRPIPMSGSADFLGETEVVEMKAQARFLRAYYHYLLFELYGPIPVITEVVNPENPDLDFARNSVDEVVDFIYSELTDIADLMPDPDWTNQERLALPTKGTALAVRARLMIYAASPLFNGGYQEALALVNPDGKRLFPDHDVSKWEKAVAALQEFIDYANAGHYELHKEYTDGVYDPHKSIYEVHMKMNKEIILARSDEQDVINGTRGGSFDLYTIPRGARGGTKNTNCGGILQELVDDFFMVDGLNIYESPLYSEDGFSEIGEDLSNQTEVGTHRMFINREPRFYNTVFYNQRKWHIGNEVISFNKGGNSDNTGNAPGSGHLNYKRVCRTVYRQAPYPNTVYRPIMIFRLAELYLLYAEALNEVNPNDPRIIEYIDKVRERAGIPLLTDIEPEIFGNQEALRKAVRREMRVELATEGQRYFDVKRWMIADGTPGEGGLGGAFHGMDMEAATLEGFYNRTVVQNRAFERKEYLFPLPQDEIQLSRLLVQNPGY